VNIKKFSAETASTLPNAVQIQFGSRAAASRGALQTPLQDAFVSQARVQSNIQKPDLSPEQMQQHAIEKNRRRGLAHARRMRAKATPAMLSQASDAQAIELQIEVRKIALPNGQKRLALFVEGAPWRIQPRENDPTVLIDYEPLFTAHDFTGHFLPSRAHVFNIPNAGGEYMTGQVPYLKQLIPATADMYDGLIANAAEHMVKRETGHFPFERLQSLLEYMRKEDVPTGTTIKFNFRRPPADITYESERTSNKKVFFPEGDLLPSDVISSAEIAALEERLICEVANSPTMGHSTQEDLSKKTVSHIYTKPVNGTDLTEVYEIAKPIVDDPAPTRGEKYFRTTMGQRISWSEGEQVKAGHKPEVISSEERVYRIPNQTTGNLDVYIFDNIPRVSRGFSSCERNIKPVYTGCPYESSQLTHIALQLPEGTSVPSNLQTEFNHLSVEYQQDFVRHQGYIRQILESGTLPLDIPITPFYSADASYLSVHEGLVKDGFIKAGSPVTIRNIQKGLFKQWKEKLEPAIFKRPPAETKGEAFYVAPFPLPPNEKSPM
jgi:hypothetical protein